jgi:hypothetical protein
MFALSQIEGTMNGNLVISAIKIHVGCINCTFGGDVSSEVVGGEMGNIVVEYTLTKTEGVFCTNGVKWDATYLVSDPAGAMYVSE